MIDLGSHFAALSGSTRTSATRMIARVHPNLGSSSSDGTTKGRGQLPGPNGAAMRVRCTTARTSGFARAAGTTPSDVQGHRASAGRGMGYAAIDGEARGAPGSSSSEASTRAR
jgi:hypothetical protein